MAVHTQSIESVSANATGSYRILIEPSWPERHPQPDPRIDLWIPELAPSEWLAARFGADPARWGTFRSRYRRQLRSKLRTRHLDRIAQLARDRDVVLVHAGLECDRNTAAVIREALLLRHAFTGRPRPA